MQQYRRLSSVSVFFVFALITLLVACGNATASMKNDSMSVETNAIFSAQSTNNFISSVSSLQETDWTKVVTEKELGCPPPVSSGDLHGVQVDAKQFADVTGDGKPEAFVAVACVGSTESWPDRLEVFDGASAPAHPRSIATLLNYQDGTDGPHGFGLRIQSIKVSGTQVVVVSKGWLPKECFACGDRQVTDTFTWNGTRFIRGPRSVVRMA